ncbi:uncharacterized protein LOC130941608 [Arachis stenosperma]|uniref:uncharacterized protein LOC130941608 n=1 Tax=Arachis stenosperma TaxID=217475 RepID=UPI0025AC400B|nr:uncharacterized protein LOC130941608 [Arachis stenosperma]
MMLKFLVHVFSSKNGLQERKGHFMRNTCSIQHVRHPFFWCLPPAFAEDVTKELPLEELTETYIPFWVKPSRFLNHIFVPIEDILGHWYCMVIDFVDKAAYHLDSYPDANMIPGREQLMKDILGRIHDLMTSPAYGPLKVNTHNNLRDWPIRRGQGIPNCNTSDSSGAWVISWLDPEGCFNSLDISGVLDDLTLRGRTAVSVVGGPFNAIGGLIRLRAQRWQRGGST